MRKSLLVLAIALAVALVPQGASATVIGTLTGTCLTHWNVNQLNSAGAELCYTYASGKLTVNGIDTGTLTNTYKTVSEVGTNGLSFSSASFKNNFVGAHDSQPNPAHPGDQPYQIDGFGLFSWDITHSNSKPDVVPGFDIATGITGSFSNNTQGNSIVFHVQFNNSCSGFVGGAGTSNNVGSEETCVLKRTPEPATLALLSAGLLGLGALKRRRK